LDGPTLTCSTCTQQLNASSRLPGWQYGWSLAVLGLTIGVLGFTLTYVRDYESELGSKHHRLASGVVG
jgi:hypothetical protein